MRSEALAAEGGAEVDERAAGVPGTRHRHVRRCNHGDEPASLTLLAATSAGLQTATQRCCRLIGPCSLASARMPMVDAEEPEAIVIAITFVRFSKSVTEVGLFYADSSGSWIVQPR